MAYDRKKKNPENTKLEGFPCIYFEGLDECTCNNDPDDPGECVYENGIEPENPAPICKYYEVNQMFYDGITINRNLLYTREEVLAILKEGGGTDCDLVTIREQYDKKFGNELMWRYPLMVGNDLGTIIIPVQEGFLSIGYNTMDSEDYEIYDLDAEFLLSAEDVQSMINAWEDYSRGLVKAMQSMWQILYMREKRNKNES
jgi:hypothetical protein